MSQYYFAKHKNGCGFGKTIQEAKSDLVNDLGEDVDYEEIKFFEAHPIKVKIEISIEEVSKETKIDESYF